MRKRKRRQADPQRIQELAKEYLDLDPTTLGVVNYDAAPKFWGPVQPANKFHHRCNYAAREILESLKGLRKRYLRELYREVCSSRIGQDNPHWMIRNISYRISMAFGLMEDTWYKHFDALLMRGPEHTEDVYGGTWRTKAQKKYKERKALTAASPWSLDHVPDLLPGKGKKGGTRSVPAPKGPKLPKGPTTVSIIRDCVTRKGGATSEEILGELKERLGSRYTPATKKTLYVQLHHHFPIKYEAAFTKKDQRYILRES